MNVSVSGGGVAANNRGKKILLVDDDQALRTVLAEQLDLYDGFTTIQVGTAAEGLEKAKLAHYDAVLLDIGLSSDQLADESRGFSFDSDGPLDLRFDPTEGEPAWKLVNRMKPDNLADIIFEYGEERYSRRIARRIAAVREKQPIRSARDFAAVVRSAIPRQTPPPRIHPATRTFQALRIAVNQELKSLRIALERIPARLAPGGRLVVISFHSLEDRLVKQAFRSPQIWECLTRSPVDRKSVV